MKISGPPTISIIMATYNRGHFIGESLQSIQDQNFEDWECLIIDDGSTDNTEDLVSKKIAADHRFTYLKRPSGYEKGLSGCRNYGLDLAKGKFIAFFDDDDIVHPENLNFCIELLRDNNYKFVRYNMQPFAESFSCELIKPIKDSKLTPFLNRDIEKMIIGEFPFASCSVLWRKSCFRDIRFNEKLMYGEEWECYSRILIEDGSIGISTDAVLYFNRKHFNSNTGQFQKRNCIRVASQLKAAELIIQNLCKERIYNEKLKTFFIRMGFTLKSYHLIRVSLKAANAGFFEKWKYNLGYRIYPVLKPMFYLKGQISER